MARRQSKSLNGYKKRKPAFRGAKATPWEEDARWSSEIEAGRSEAEYYDDEAAVGWDAQVDAVIARRAKKICSPSQIRSAMSLINDIQAGRIACGKEGNKRAQRIAVSAILGKNCGKLLKAKRIALKVCRREAHSVGRRG